jgi:hypothetical protein
MKWVKVYIPRAIAELTGAAAGRAGVPRDTAICAALWMFGRNLSMAEKRDVINHYLQHGLPNEAGNQDATK